MRRAALAVLAVLALAGCGTGAQPSSGRTVSLDDGRTVQCAVTAGGGIDCDWAGAR